MPGRPPKPTALKVLQGNPGKRPLPKDEPQPTTMDRLPPPPRHLLPEARREWRRMGRELLRLGLYTVIDKPAFAVYCQEWGRWVEAEAHLAETGAVLTSPKSRVEYQSPWLAIANRAMDEMLKAATQFGMTPAARARVQAAKPKAEEDPLEALRKRRQG